MRKTKLTLIEKESVRAFAKTLREQNLDLTPREYREQLYLAIEIVRNARAS